MQYLFKANNDTTVDPFKGGHGVEYLFKGNNYAHYLFWGKHTVQYLLEGNNDVP